MHRERDTPRKPLKSVVHDTFKDYKESRYLEDEEGDMFMNSTKKEWALLPAELPMKKLISCIESLNRRFPQHGVDRN